MIEVLRFGKLLILFSVLVCLCVPHENIKPVHLTCDKIRIHFIVINLFVDLIHLFDRI